MSMMQAHTIPGIPHEYGLATLSNYVGHLILLWLAGWCSSQVVQHLSLEVLPLARLQRPVRQVTSQCRTAWSVAVCASARLTPALLAVIVLENWFDRVGQNP